MRVVGYCRVSTAEQGESGAGLDWQDSTLRAAIAAQGHELVEMFVDVGSGKSTKKRPRLAAALAVLAAGEADMLMVAKLDRLSRSMLDFATLMQQAGKEGWSISALDVAVDTSTTNGELMAHIIMALAQWERRIISDRTKAALAEVRSRGTQLGRPVTLGTDAEAIIRVMRRQSASLYQIARTLNDEAVPTSQGGARWHASSVRAICLRLGL